MTKVDDADVFLELCEQYSDLYMRRQVLSSVAKHLSEDAEIRRNSESNELELKILMWRIIDLATRKSPL